MSLEFIKTLLVALLSISLVATILMYRKLNLRQRDIKKGEKGNKWLWKNWIWLVSIGILIIWGNTFLLLFADSDKGLGDVGKFGDMFGAVNALFSGLAFAGMIYAIVLQSRELAQTNKEMGIQNEMLELQKNELAKTNEMMEQQTKSLELQNETLRLQNEEMLQTRKEFQQQNQTLSIQRFENTFFQLLNLHHELIDKLDCSKINIAELGKDGETGRAALKFAAKALKVILEGKERSVLSSVARDKVTKAQAWDAVLRGYDDFYFEREFELELSHYFRNLYHIFKYVYLSNDISMPQKKFYATLVRSQLSPDELFLTHYNAMRANVGNPKFLFLIKEFDLMQNFNNWKVREFVLHEEILEDLLENVKNPFTGKVVNAVPNLNEE